MKTASPSALLACILLLLPGLAGAQSNDCCPGQLSVGFSRTRIASDVPFEGILGVDRNDAEERCAADAGEIGIEVPAGATGEAEVYANIISQLPVGLGVQAWTFSIELEGDADFFILSHEGTAAGRQPDGFRPTTGFSLEFLCMADPAQSGGRRGVVSTLIFCVFGCPFVTLPPTGTQSVMRMVLRSSHPQGSEDQTATLSFRDGLFGPCSGTIMDNIITVDAASQRPCNLDTARVRFVFQGRPPSGFVRGDVNADSALNITDGVFILNYLFLGGEPPGCLDAADTNDSGVLNISDGVGLFNYLFLGGPAPPAPGPSTCGPDPNEDEVSCRSFPRCT